MSARPCALDPSLPEGFAKKSNHLNRLDSLLDDISHTLPLRPSLHALFAAYRAVYHCVTLIPLLPRRPPLRPTS